MYNVCYVNEENEMIVHERVTVDKVFELVQGLNVMEALTIVNISKERRHETPVIDPSDYSERFVEMVGTAHFLCESLTGADTANGMPEYARGMVELIIDSTPDFTQDDKDEVMYLVLNWHRRKQA